MEIYISKNCPHCKKLLLVFYNNKYLIQYFNILDIESTTIPAGITSVPTLIYNGELYFDEKMYNLIDDVNQHHLRENNMGNSQQRQNNNIPEQRMGPPMGTQELGGKNDNMRNPNLQNMQRPNQEMKPKPAESPKEEGEILGICEGEDCLYENINEEKGFNNVGQSYCFLEEDVENNNQSNINESENKSSKFDNKAYEDMMKNRGI